MSAPSRRAMEISLGALFLVTLGILAFMATRMGSLSGFGDVVDVTVRFDDASGLVEDASVKIAGVEVGKVTRLAIDFDAAVATLELRASAQVRKDALAAIRSRSLLGEKFVELKPRSRDAALAADGDTLEAEPGGVALEELAQVLGPTVEGMKLEEVSAQAREVLAMALRQEEPIGRILARIDGILERAERVPFDDPQMIDDLQTAVRQLREASEGLPAMASDARDTLASTRTLVTSLEPTVEQVNVAAKDLPDLVAQTEDALTRLNRILEILEPQAKRLENLDYSFVRYVFRQEGLLVRLVEKDVPQFDPGVEWDDTPRPYTPAQEPEPRLLFPGEEPARGESGGPMSQGDEGP